MLRTNIRQISNHAQDKLEYIKKEQQADKLVAMTGDRTHGAPVDEMN